MKKSGMIYSRANTSVTQTNPTHLPQNLSQRTEKDLPPCNPYTLQSVNSDQEQQQNIYFTLDPTEHRNKSNHTSLDDSMQECLPSAKYVFPNYLSSGSSFEESSYVSENQSLNADSLAIYQNPITKNAKIVKKLNYINKIFKQLAQLKKLQFQQSQREELSIVQNQIIELQREILRN